ncbi:LOW QUALITY PROTEIN: uncharacterized protein LOC124262225 [Haliotis rubra]|uniref:LOW QUALITY PROTEIN: uncharacterized protein LOC124262225 n=1 Tax=Haliotis rubra TaxID=36100 RepID=UPI001EE566EA|nr:LOW QUALITY PROTEIN: uncharacterized protein LOC124262225 [Haliotis rubra]
MDIFAPFACLIFLNALLCCHCEVTLTSSIHLMNINGHVTFKQSAVNQATSVTFNLTGVTGSLQWELRQSWVDFTVKYKCGDMVIGTSLPNIGSTISTGQETLTIQSSVVSDLSDLMGRSLLLANGSDKACGTLVMPSAQYRTASVQFQGSINGEIWFRQAEGMRTELRVDLFQPASTTTDYAWKIYSGTVPNCKSLTALFDPSSKSAGACSTNNPGACAVGDLTGRLGRVMVGATAGSARKFVHDMYLNLSGDANITGNTLVLLDNANMIVSCGKIMAVTEKQASAVFNKAGVVGSVHFKQASPFELTEISVALSRLARKAGGYHVHLYPVPYQQTASQQLCSQDAVGGHWNPFGMPFPTTGSTTDRFEVGDISGKFGNLADRDSYYQTMKDYNMPMFGPYSIIGRSAVVHKSVAGAPRWICANINDLRPRSFAAATFKYPIIGKVIFSQAVGDPMSDTWIFGQLNYADGTANPSQGHRWSVHENKVGDDAMKTPGRCASVGPIVNPFRANMSGDYSSQCKMSNPLRCPVGAMTKLTGALKIRLQNGAPSKFFFTSRNVPLSGAASVVAKSMLILSKDNGDAPLACADMIHLRTRYATVDKWVQNVTGFINFTQNHGDTSDDTLVSIDIENLGRQAGGYHIHELPVPSDSKSPCSGASVAGHYNPFKVIIANSPSPTNGTYDQFEVGDLSGKYGLLNNESSEDIEKRDNMINLFGQYSVVGRSVVIHKMVAGARWTCGNITEDVSMTGGMKHMAKAMFNASHSGISGSVTFTQYVYADGSMSDTTVFANLVDPDGRSTTGHMMAVGSRSAWGDRKSSSKRCDSAGAKFNPFLVNTQTRYSECSISNPLRCSVGDMSGRLGTCSVGGKNLYTDINLSIFGKYSVIGRSFVLYGPDGSTDRIACTNILPMSAMQSSLFIEKSASMSTLEIARTYARALDTNEWNVVVSGDDSKGDGCISVLVHFIGNNASGLRARFNQMVSQGGNGKLGAFSPVTCSADKLGVSIVLVSLLLLCKKIIL